MHTLPFWCVSRSQKRKTGQATTFLTRKISSFFSSSSIGAVRAANSSKAWQGLPACETGCLLTIARPESRPARKLIKLSVRKLCLPANAAAASCSLKKHSKLIRLSPDPARGLYKSYLIFSFQVQRAERLSHKQYYHCNRYTYRCRQGLGFCPAAPSGLRRPTHLHQLPATAPDPQPAHPTAHHPLLPPDPDPVRQGNGIISSPLDTFCPEFESCCSAGRSTAVVEGDIPHQRRPSHPGCSQ